MRSLLCGKPFMSQILAEGKVNILEHAVLLKSARTTVVLVALTICNSLARGLFWLQYLFFKILNTKSVLKFPKTSVGDNLEYLCFVIKMC